MTTDFAVLLNHLSQSLAPVQPLIIGMAYFLGTLFVFNAFLKFKKLGEAARGSQGEEKLTGALYYFFGGVVLLFMPTLMQMLSATAFGRASILQYAQFNSLDILSGMQLLLQTAGIIWFLRGCVLVIHTSTPGDKGGKKGIMFIIAAIFAMNIQTTVGMMDSFLKVLFNITKG